MNKFKVTRIRGDENGETVLKGLTPNKQEILLALEITDTYKTDMLSALSDAYSDMVVPLGKEDNEQFPDPDYIDLLKSIGGAISYLHNCQSGRDNKLYEFDKYELEQRFQKIVNNLK